MTLGPLRTFWKLHKYQIRFLHNMSHTYAHDACSINCELSNMLLIWLTQATFFITLYLVINWFNALTDLWTTQYYCKLYASIFSISIHHAYIHLIPIYNYLIHSMLAEILLVDTNFLFKIIKNTIQAFLCT